MVHQDEAVNVVSVVKFPGKTARSHIKHGLAWKVVNSQVHAFCNQRGSRKIVLIDGNAGDGDGVLINPSQPDFFMDETMSRSTPQILSLVAHQVGNAEVVLCEKDYDCRVSLMHRFPEASVIEDHKFAPLKIREEHYYALYLSDSNGPASQGVEPMVAISKLPIRSDFVIIENQHFFRRVMGVGKEDMWWNTSKKRYLPRVDPQWWRELLGKRYLACSVEIGQSENYKFRIMVASEYLADACHRYPFTAIYSAKGVQSAR